QRVAEPVAEAGQRPRQVGGIQRRRQRGLGHYGFSVRSNSSWMRRYSSYQLSGWVKPWRSSGYGASSHLSLRSSISFCAIITESVKTSWAWIVPCASSGLAARPAANSIGEERL